MCKKVDAVLNPTKPLCKPKPLCKTQTHAKQTRPHRAKQIPFKIPATTQAKTKLVEVSPCRSAECAGWEWYRVCWLCRMAAVSGRSACSTHSWLPFSTVSPGMAKEWRLGTSLVSVARDCLACGDTEINTWMQCCSTGDSIWMQCCNEPTQCSSKP